MDNWKMIDVDRTRGWCTLGVEKRGRSHEQKGTLCQDAVRVVRFGDGIVAAVSDGVGSLQNSHIASNAAVDAVVEWFRSNYKDLDRNLLEQDEIRADLVRAVRKRIQQIVRGYRFEPDSLDCNLAFVFLLPRQRVICGCLGDCAVCVVGKNSRVLTTYSDSANGTDTVLGTQAESRMTVKGWNIDTEQIQGFLLTTDGLENEIYAKNSSVLRRRAEDYFNAALDADAMAQLKTMIEGLSAYFEDDIGMVLLSRARERVVLEEDPTWICTCGTRNPMTVSYCRSCRNDFVALYKNVGMGRDREAFFRGLNHRPEEERKLLAALSGHDVPEWTADAVPTDREQDDAAEQRAESEPRPARKARTRSAPSTNRSNTDRRRQSSPGVGIGGHNIQRILQNYDMDPELNDEANADQEAKETARRHQEKERENVKDLRVKENTDDDLSQGQPDRKHTHSAVPVWMVSLLIGAIFVLFVLVGMLYVENHQIKQQLTQIMEVVGIRNEQEDPQNTAADDQLYIVVDRRVSVGSIPGEDDRGTVRKSDLVTVVPDTWEQGEDGKEWVMIRTENDVEGWCRFDSLMEWNANEAIEST